MPLYAGFDASTQSFTTVVIEVEGDHREVVLERSLSFDALWPAYGTRHGVLPSAEEAVAEAPPLMWAEALDHAMEELAASGLDLGRLRAVAGSAQQHGSVYLAPGAAERLAALAPDRPLVAQLRGEPAGTGRPLLSRARSPIWLDASTEEDCEAITAGVGGPLVLAQLTGSRAFERFTGPQIRKFWRLDPQGYARTERIHLVSSFLASLLAGRHAPIDPGDGSGMNLMDLRRRAWAPAALHATAPGLEEKLPPIVPSWEDLGPLAPYWQQRHGLPPARVIAWSGDNPCSLVGTGLVREGVARVIVVGPDAAIREVAAREGIDLAAIEIVDPQASPLAPAFAEALHELRRSKGMTPAQASEAVAGGRVHVNGARVKPSRALKVGDHVSISQHGRDGDLHVRAIPARRGPAPEARECYEETPESLARAAKHREQHRLAAMAAPRPEGRPDKKSRRELIELERKQGRE